MACRRPFLGPATGRILSAPSPPYADSTPTRGSLGAVEPRSTGLHASKSGTQLRRAGLGNAACFLRPGSARAPPRHRLARPPPSGEREEGEREEREGKRKNGIRVFKGLGRPVVLFTLGPSSAVGLGSDSVRRPPAPWAKWAGAGHRFSQPKPKFLDLEPMQGKFCFLGLHIYWAFYYY